jgi:hypothetical protein
MIEELEYEIYLCIEKNKFSIFLLDKNKSLNLYKNETTFDENNNINFEELSKFLDNNIFKIEKLLGKFITNIFLIIEDNSEIQTNISIRKKNDNNMTNQKDLNQVLVESKNLFKENNSSQNIIHMLIDNFIIDGDKYNFFVEKLKSDYLYLDVKFISLSDKLIYKFDKLLEKYQIKIQQFISGKYLKELKRDKDLELSLMAQKMRDGFNPNEIVIIPKIQTNKGFFEKFFQLFS